MISTWQLTRASLSGWQFTDLMRRKEEGTRRVRVGGSMGRLRGSQVAGSAWAEPGREGRHFEFEELNDTQQCQFLKLGAWGGSRGWFKEDSKSHICWGTIDIIPGAGREPLMEWSREGGGWRGRFKQENDTIGCTFKKNYSCTLKQYMKPVYFSSFPWYHVNSSCHNKRCTENDF